MSKALTMPGVDSEDAQYVRDALENRLSLESYKSSEEGLQRSMQQEWGMTRYFIREVRWLAGSNEIERITTIEGKNVGRPYLLKGFEQKKSALAPHIDDIRSAVQQAIDTLIGEKTNTGEHFVRLLGERLIAAHRTDLSLPGVEVTRFGRILAREGHRRLRAAS